MFSFFFFLSFFCFSDETSGEPEWGLFPVPDMFVKSLERGAFVAVRESSASDSPEDSGSEDSTRAGQSSTASAVSLVGVFCTTEVTYTFLWNFLAKGANDTRDLAMARYRFIEEREIVEDSVETSNETTKQTNTNALKQNRLLLSTLYKMGDHCTAVEREMAASDSSRVKSLPLTTVVEITIVCAAILLLAKSPLPH